MALKSRRIARTRARRGLGFEGLEARELLATLYVATSGSDAANGAINAPLQSIQKAVNLANSGDEIRVAAGTYAYTPSADLYNAANNLSYSSVMGTTPVVGIVDKRLTILGGFTTSNWVAADPAANATVIDGQGAHRGVMAQAFVGATSLRLEGFTIQNGVAGGIAIRGGIGATYGFGGALFVDMGGRQNAPEPWVFKDLVFRNNKAVGTGSLSGEGGKAAGGAVALRYATNVAFNNVVFDANQALGADGPDLGGGALGGAIHVDHSNVIADSVTFTNNLARSGNAPNGSGVGSVHPETADALGGGLAIVLGSNVTFSNVRATGNQAVAGNAANRGDARAGASFGGAFYAEGPNVNLTLVDAFIQGNTARGGDAGTPGIAGGGAVETHNASLVLDRAQVLGNVAQSGQSTTGGEPGAAGGGGLYLTRFSGDSTSTITNTVIAGNVVSIPQPEKSANNGGGGGGLWIQGMPANIRHSTIDANVIDGRLEFGQAMILLNFGAATPATVNIGDSILSNHVPANPRGVAVKVFDGNAATLTSKALSWNNPSFSNGTVNGLGNLVTDGLRQGQPSLYRSAGSPNWDYQPNTSFSNPAVGSAAGSQVGVDLFGNPREGVPELGAVEVTIPRFGISSPIQVVEGGQARIVVTRRGDLANRVSVQLYAISGGSATVGADYQIVSPNDSATFTFEPGEASKTITVATTDNAAVNADKTLILGLRMAPGSESLGRVGSPDRTTVTIVDNDAPPPVIGFQVGNVANIYSRRGATGVILTLNAPLQIRRGRPIKGVTVARLSPTKSPGLASVRYNAALQALIVAFRTPLKVGTKATIVLNPALIKDVAGRTLAGDSRFTITA